MSHWGLTAEELLFLWLVFVANGNEGHPELFKQWYDNGGRSILRQIFESLKEKGVIRKDYNPEKFSPETIEFNKIFLKGWYKHSTILGQELMSIYPSFVHINGMRYPLKDVTKNGCSTLDEFFFNYSKQIGHNPDKHKEIIELVKWGIANNYPFGNLSSFVASHLWDSIKEMRDDPDNIVTNITRDE